MNTKQQRLRGAVVLVVVLTIIMGPTAQNMTGQVRAARQRGVVVKGEEGKGAAVGRHGAVVKGDEGYVATGRHGAVVAGEEGYVAAGRRGGVVVGNRYEDHDAWKAAAAVGAAIAIGTMLARPPAASTTVVVGGSTYWYHDSVYYSRVYSGGNVAYQVVNAPAGAIIRTLPVGCATAQVGAVVYQRCGATYYQPVSNGYRVVVLH